jgi:starch phosphorylase
MPGISLDGLPAELSALKELALDLRWTWSHEADALWMRIDAKSWSRTRNPWTILQDASAATLRQLAADPSFVEHLQVLASARKAYSEVQTWFRATHPNSGLGGVAFFSMEFGLGDALPIYAGGLGVLAGDFLKTASDLGLPVVGVGLLYQSGYFGQRIDATGRQQEVYPYNDPSSLPIEPAIDAAGGWLHIPIELPGRTLIAKVWQAVVGRTKLYLLDTNDVVNSFVDRGITAKLYDATPEIRLMQEIVLGVGGWRAICALAPAVDVCHLNEGHAAFLILERARQAMGELRLSPKEALWATRAGNLFTTHTSVGSGFDSYPPDLVEKYLRSLYGSAGVDAVGLAEILALGRQNSGNGREPFNMTYLALRGSLLSFGVSRRHGCVSRKIFQQLFPCWPEPEVPVAHITNGVHIPSWDSEDSDRIWTEACGKERWRYLPDDLSAAIAALPDEALWEMRAAGRKRLVVQARARLKRHVGERGLGEDAVRIADRVLDPNLLTLGFARRFTGYKRPNLLLREPARLARLLEHPTRPVQLIIAGKAHPADQEGKDMIHEWIAMAQRPEFRFRLVFLEDYDLTLAQELVQGVDVWINTPRRPWEACGTSGMKILVNGGLNLSELDGWWEEAYSPQTGWAIGGGSEPGGPDEDAGEAEELYSAIEQSIVPEFYDRDAAGIPRRWIARIRKSMADLTPQYSANRMARDYVTQGYLPISRRRRDRIEDGGKPAREMHLWAERLRQSWPSLHIGEPSIASADASLTFSVPVYFGDLQQDDLRVEIYADPLEEGTRGSLALERGDAIPGAVNGNVYSARISAARPARDYTVRVIPCRPDVQIPSELALIHWQK